MMEASLVPLAVPLAGVRRVNENRLDRGDREVRWPMARSAEGLGSRWLVCVRLHFPH